MHSFSITERVRSPVNAILFDLFHGGQVTVSGRSIRLARPVLPVPVRKSDHIEWQFREPVKVSTPGPDSQISVVKQYKDRIELTVWPWANIRIEFQQ